MNEVLSLVEHSLRIKSGEVTVVNESILRANIGKLARVSALDNGERAAQARYLIRAAALAWDIVPASIHALYLAL